MSALDIQKARRRWASQNLLESESLTADLPDQEAKQLLQWALAQVDQLVKRTAKLPPDDAQAIIEQELTILRKLIRSINKMVGEGRPASPERLRKRLERLLASAQEIYLPQPSADQIESYLDQHPQLGTAEKLQHLLSLLGHTPAQHRPTPSDKEFS